MLSLITRTDIRGYSFTIITLASPKSWKSQFYTGVNKVTLLPQRHANLVFLHARRQPFPAFQELAEALQVVWPWGEAACVQEVVERLGERWKPSEKEAAVWK